MKWIISIVVTIHEDQQSELTGKDDESAIWPQVKFVQCPIKTSLGVLGKKWTMLILRDIGFLKIVRFNRIFRIYPWTYTKGSINALGELEDEGFMNVLEEKTSNYGGVEVYRKR